MHRSLVIVPMLLLSAAAAAQDAPPGGKSGPPAAARAPYRLEYLIKELDDGKVINTRTYSVMLQSAEDRRDRPAELKTGTRVPVRMNTPKEGESQIQYLDVGINISAALLVEGPNLVLVGSVEISTLSGDQGAAGNPPLIRQVRSNTTSEVTPGKVNQVAVLDDPISKHRFEIDVTPTKLR